MKKLETNKRKAPTDRSTQTHQMKNKKRMVEVASQTGGDPALEIQFINTPEKPCSYLPSPNWKWLQATPSHSNQDMLVDICCEIVPSVGGLGPRVRKSLEKHLDGQVQYFVFGNEVNSSSLNENYDTEDMLPALLNEFEKMKVTSK